MSVAVPWVSLVLQRGHSTSGGPSKCGLPPSTTMDPRHSGIFAVYQDNDPSRDMSNADIVRAIRNLEEAAQRGGLDPTTRLSLTRPG